MSISLNKNKTVPLKDIFYYFDALERDRLDGGKNSSQKVIQINTLRDRLFMLPDEDFGVIIETIDRILAGVQEKGKPGEKTNKMSPKESLEAYERLNEKSPSVKTSTIKVIPRI